LTVGEASDIAGSDTKRPTVHETLNETRPHGVLAPGAPNAGSAFASASQ
jgi:hypothetical protein